MVSNLYEGILEIQARAGARTLDLFLPIYTIGTIYICAENYERVFPDRNDCAISHLCHFGRPLWDSLLKKDESIEAVWVLAHQKISGIGHS